MTESESESDFLTFLLVRRLILVSSISSSKKGFLLDWYLSSKLIPSPFYKQGPIVLKEENYEKMSSCQFLYSSWGKQVGALIILCIYVG